MDERRFAAPAERNREPILAVLRRVLPARGTLLEIASGTGQHVAHFAQALPAWTFQPSARELEMHASIAAWCAGLPNVLPPLLLDVTQEPWPIARCDALFNANMIHIAPWPVCEALLRGAARCLPPGGPLVLYGPFRIAGAHTAESNAAFDARLRAEDPSWGVRDLEAVCEVAAAHGLVLRERVAMPANNQTLIFAHAESV
jgi:SAM-dependent methyltransferase